MVVEHRQRMAARAIEEGEVTLEVHLPQLVGCRALKARKGTRRRRSLIEQTVAAQDAGDSARRELGAALEQQPSASLRPPQQPSTSRRIRSTCPSTSDAVRNGECIRPVLVDGFRRYGWPATVVLIIRRPRARTSASIARLSSKSCATSTHQLRSLPARVRRLSRALQPGAPA